MSDDSISGCRDRLQQFKGRWPEICQRSGLGYSWLSKFARSERGRRPSFDLITRLQGALDEMEAESTPTASSTESPH